ncbi:uncharacterized protein N7484_008250 [Penicillium longicatenatum]|uniref:uncharacterized protein n=1 Tax=Penicillium longicatenatum TaxID=1561947 RepID=UPI002547834A|nr:uncharacterized protein N7484_008250 [Penicillium longicatenatum]KAJ5634937.1 hypothetical protein N7484_008250 [Penicillium longicatenatum]
MTSFVAKLQVRGGARIQAVTYAVEFPENTEKQFMRQLGRPLRGRPKVLVDVEQTTDFEFGDITPDEAEILEELEMHPQLNMPLTIDFAKLWQERNVQIRIAVEPNDFFYNSFVIISEVQLEIYFTV